MNANHREPLDVASLLTSLALLLIVSIPALFPKFLRVLAFVVVGWYFHRIILTQTTGYVETDIGLGSALLFHYMQILDIGLLTPPEEFVDLRDNDPTRVTERPLKRRITWLLKISSNPRGIGLAHEPSHLFPRPSPSIPRFRFVIWRILFAACCYTTLLGAYLLFNYSYASIPTADKLLTGSPLRWRVLGVMSFGLCIVCALSGHYAVFSACIVSCGFSSPDRWPLLFGSPLHLWSIRGFWRKFWHQMIRRPVLTCTSSLLGCVFPAEYIGTRSYKLARLYIVFCISGLGHAGGDAMATGKFGYKSFAFFSSQAVGITIELIVADLWRRFQPVKVVTSPANKGKKSIERIRRKRHGASLEEDSIPPLWIRCVGLIWLSVWIVWTAAYMVDVLHAARLSKALGKI